MSAGRAALWGLLLLGGAARAQRPDESSLFGGADAGTAPRAAAARPDGGSTRPSEETLFGPADAGAVASPTQPGSGTAPTGGESSESRLTKPSRMPATGAVKEDPLKIGGLYTRLHDGAGSAVQPVLVSIPIGGRLPRRAPDGAKRAFVLGRPTTIPSSPPVGDAIPDHRRHDRQQPGVPLGPGVARLDIARTVSSPPAAST
jgi:hypothetical protein